MRDQTLVRYRRWRDVLEVVERENPAWSREACFVEVGEVFCVAWQTVRDGVWRLSRVGGDQDFSCL